MENRLFNFILGRNTEKRQLEYITPYSDALNFPSSNITGSSMSLSAVCRAVNIISDSIAIMPIKVKDNDALHIDDADSQVKFIFSNGVMSEYTLKACLIRDVLISGNGYAYIKRKGGIPIEIVYCSPNSIQANYIEKTNTISYVSNNFGKINPQDIIHLKKYTVNGYTGVSVLTYANRALDISKRTEAHAQNFFTSGCNLSGVITVEGQVNERQREQIRQSWASAYGPTGNGGLAILQGNMKYDPIQLNATDSQLLESRRFNVEDIARFFGIPSIMLTGDQANNLEGAQNQFLLHCLQPYITMFEQEFTQKLFPNFDYRIKLDTTALLKTDKTAIANYYNTLLQNGVLCINEVRKELGYSPIENGEKHIIPYTDINQNTINNNKEEDKTNLDNNKEDDK